jgi:hypothetical protein
MRMTNDKVVPIVPAQFARQCDICKRDLDTRRQGDVAQWIGGWADKGGDLVEVSETADRWAHVSCVEYLEYLDSTRN